MGMRRHPRGDSAFVGVTPTQAGVAYQPAATLNTTSNTQQLNTGRCPLTRLPQTPSAIAGGGNSILKNIFIYQRGRGEQPTTAQRRLLLLFIPQGPHAAARAVPPPTFGV